MKKLMIWILLSVAVSGCVTARLSKGPDTDVLVQHEDTAPVGVAKAVDDRESEKVGTIGAQTIKVKKSDLTELVSNYLVKYINEKVGLNVERVQINEADSVKLAAVKNKVDGIMILRIKQLGMYSINASLKPVEVDLTLELTVFDESGGEIYYRVAQGHYEKRIGISIVESSTGKLVEAAVKDALMQFVIDPKLKRIIAEFKYGILGSLISIF